MSSVMTYLSSVWPVLASLTIVGVITYGSIMPYVRKDRQRRLEEENQDD